MIKTSHDKFKERTTSFTDKVIVGTSNIIEFTLRHVKVKENDLLVIDAWYNGENWIFLRTGYLYFSVDEQILKLKAQENYTEVLKGNSNQKTRLEESTHYLISKEILKQICDGSKVEAKITGKKIDETLDLVKFHILCQQFYNKFYDSSLYATSLGKKTSGCFIATATYGNYNHPQVVELRIFRDKYLNKSKTGRAFIKAYYFIGPYFAEIIKDSNELRKISREYLIQPILTFIRRHYK